MHTLVPFERLTLRAGDIQGIDVVKFDPSTMIWLWAPRAGSAEHPNWRSTYAGRHNNLDVVWHFVHERMTEASAVDYPEITDAVGELSEEFVMLRLALDLPGACESEWFFVTLSQYQLLDVQRLVRG